MKKIHTANKAYVAAAFFVVLTGCAAVSTTETAYVFDAEQAIDNPFPKDTMCPEQQTGYKGIPPAYFAIYKPNPDLKAYVRLIAPMVHDTHVGAEKSADPENSGIKQFKKLKAVVYPVPFKAGYYFTPAKVRLDINGQTLQPVAITKMYTINHEVEKQYNNISREKLKAQSGELLAYLAEFDIEAAAAPTAVLHVDGFDFEGKPVEEQTYALHINDALLDGRQYSIDCAQ